MVWHSTKDFPKKRGRRVLLFSPLYPNEVDRFRMVDSQFVRICKDATHWAYLEKPVRKPRRKPDKCTCSVSPMGYTRVVQLTLDDDCPFHKHYITKG